MRWWLKINRILQHSDITNNQMVNNKNDDID